MDALGPSRSFAAPCAAAALLAFTGGCALGPGGPFATLEPTLEARLVRPADREAEGGWHKLNTDFEVFIETASVELGAIELRELGAGAASFDPANPPERYSLCHGGHCHRDDGALVSYEDIAAELSGGAGARVVTRLPVGAVDLLAQGRRELGCQPSCDLPLADLGGLRAPLLRIDLAGRVRDGRSPPRFQGELPFLLGLTLEGSAAVTVRGDLDLPADRKHPPNVALALSFEPTAALLDEIAWESLSVAGGKVDLAASENAAAKGALLEHLAVVPLEAKLSRSR